MNEPEWTNTDNEESNDGSGRDRRNIDKEQSEQAEKTLYPCLPGLLFGISANSSLKVMLVAV
ncbi:hypothetical protein [Candidatus Methylomicrobium oryzae]|uniref:hypothetical protein n=1 Tax=Candidatus Methylomicrobium oryzae TaxID=2802053 RepID=UPI001920CE5A|nr:hypothetical protein [Methylomicrobium sp. RS1]